MNKLEFLSASLPHKIKCQYKWKTMSRVEIKQNIFRLDSINLMSKYGYWTNDKKFLYQFGGEIGVGFKSKDIYPIVRPLFDLTKECVQADYNDGKPFVPIVELANICNCDADYLFLDAWEERDYRKTILNSSPFKFIKLLLKWHFNLMDESEEVIYVNETFNPYINK